MLRHIVHYQLDENEINDETAPGKTLHTSNSEHCQTRLYYFEKASLLKLLTVHHPGGPESYENTFGFMIMMSKTLYPVDHIEVRGIHGSILTCSLGFFFNFIPNRETEVGNKGPRLDSSHGRTSLISLLITCFVLDYLVETCDSEWNECFVFAVEEKEAEWKQADSLCTKQTTVTYLGKVVGQGEVHSVLAKVEAIQGFPVPNTKKELMRFLGMIGYYRSFCRNFSTVVAPLTNLLSPPSYSSDNAKIGYVVNLLRGKASDWATALWQANSPVLQSFDSFIAEMKKVFDHPVQGQEAVKRLLDLRQGSQSVAAYSVDFSILAAASGWDSLALKWIFYKGLAEKIKDKLSLRDEPDSLDSLISLAIRIDNRLQRTTKGKRDF
ncbi:hypothetical protein L3Q82_005453 [Scortum barcoo]|uniref:Uncharacterized protein n=1 Tax=Scortum barcoo TaxID=214431 RepID=A0ACB8VAG1_9TELE|nr:hypothetical protein L3Q82_005453 [Scortum barcoo]